MPTPDEVLTIELDADIGKAVRQMGAFQKEVTKQFKKLTKSVSDMGQANETVTKEAVEDTRKWVKGLGALARYHKDEIGLIKNLEANVTLLEKKREKADAQQQKAYSARIKDFRKEIADKKKALKISTDAGFDVSKTGKKAKEAILGASNDLQGAVGRGLGDAFSGFFSKDLPGIIGGSGKVLTGAFGSALRGLAAGGARMKARGAEKQRERAAAGKAPGMAGGAMKAIGGIFAKLGPLMNTMAKIAPLLSTIGTAFMAIVKVMIDAESQAKQFNKDILQSASTVEILAANGWEADGAFNQLEDTLGQLREAAYSLENLDWGISAEEHKAVLNVLTQEGVSLQRIREEAQSAGKEVSEFAADLTHVSVAYSRAFGVPLQEINQLQSEMMTDLGMTMDQTKQSFATMTRAAADSGISANRFFAVIKGVSQDLSLYNLRLDKSIKLFTALNKVMNPREAQKFFGTVMQGMKGMDITSRTKIGLMAPTGDILAKEQKGRYKELGKALKMDPKEVEKVLKTEGAAGLESAIGGLEKSRQGSIRQLALMTGRAGRAAGRGPVGTATAMGMAGPGASAEIMKRAVMTFGKGYKTLDEAIGDMGVMMTANMLGVSEDQLHGSADLEYAVNSQRDTLKRQLEQGGAERAKALWALEQANLTEADINKASWDEILATMGEDQRAMVEANAEQMTPMEKMAKDQGKLTQSVLDQLTVLVDFIMNQIYSVMVDIWGGLSRIASKFGLGPSKEEEERRRIEVAAKRMEPGKQRDEVMAAMKHASGLGADQWLKEVKPVWDKMVQTKFEAGRLPTGADLMGGGPGDTNLEAVKAFAAADIPAISKELKLSKKQEEELAMLQFRLLEDIKSGIPLEDLVGGGPGEVGTGGYFAPLEEILAPVREAKKAEKQGGQEPLLKPGSGMSSEELYQQDLKILGRRMADKNKADREAWAAQAVQDGEILKVDEQGNVKLDRLITTFNTGNTAYFKMPSSVLRGEYKKTIHDAFLEALRLGLFEYYLYSDLDKEKVIEKLKSGEMTIPDFSQQLGEGAEMGVTPKDLFGLEPAAKKKQFGALMTGIKDGKAILKPPPSGEAFVPAMPGEEIVPSYARGGGGKGGTQHVLITLDPNAQQMFRAEVQDGIYEHERRKKFG